MVMEYIEMWDKLQSNMELEMGRGMAAVMKRAPTLWPAPDVGGASSLLPSLSWSFSMVEFAAMEVWWL